MPRAQSIPRAGDEAREAALLEALGRAENALRGTEERWRTLFHSAHEGMLVYDRSLRIVAANQAAERILGLPLGEILHAAGFTSLLRCVHADGRPVTRETRPTRLMVEGGEPLSAYVIGIQRPGGAHTWLSVSTAFLRHAGSSHWYGVVSTFTDITAQRNAEQALRESEERYRRTFELAGSGLAHIGLDRKFIRVNRRLCEILGYPEHELVGLTGRQISHPEDLDVINRLRPGLYAGGMPHVRVEKRYLRKDASVVWVTLSMVVERDAAGTPLYEIAIFDDITERKRAEAALAESEQRFRSLTQLSSDWYWEQDAELRLTFMSRLMSQRTGLDPAAYLGRRRWEQPALNLSEEGWARHRAQLERHEPFRDFEMHRPNPDGGSRWISLSGEPVFDAAGRFQGYRGVGSDVTERKRAEAELRRAHDALAQKAQELERSNAELEQFAYVASHDLQEPLRMVSSYTQLLAKRYAERLEGDAKEFMHYIVDGAARMKQLIEDLLAYSRVGTRGREFRPLALETPLRKALVNLRAAIEEAGAAVTWEALPAVAADEAQLAQLFQNLIGNALKFRGPSVPRIQVSASEKEHEWELVVADNGVGIEPQYFERIFMLFQRLHTLGEYPGTGIGLAICRKVVERHGGRIWVSSQPGAGSRFHFTLKKQAGP